jgi:Transposase/Helix-turn-helix domain of transposase family ISL3
MRNAGSAVATVGFGPNGSNFADRKARVTRRLRQQIGLDCPSMPTSHAAVRHGVSWSKAKAVRGSKRTELQQLFAANRRLFKAYVLREQLDRLWTYKTRTGVLNFLNGWCDALRWLRLPEMERPGEFLFKHLDGIAAYCDHQVRFGVVESINTTIKGVLRRARGMRDERMLLLKLKWATAHPIRSARDLARFRRTASGPRLRTCVYTIVVLTSAWPSSSCIAGSDSGSSPTISSIWRRTWTNEPPCSR